MPFIAISRATGFVCALLAVVAVSQPVSAQQPAQPTPAEAQQQMDAMAPMMVQMTRAMLQAGLEFYAQPATARAMATFTKNYHEALIAVGFTRDDALRIVAAHGLPTLPGAGK